MKIFTLIGAGDQVIAHKSWTKLDAKVLKEIKNLILYLETGFAAPPKEDREAVEENYLCTLTVAEVKSRGWDTAPHLSELIWSDDCDDFYLVTSEID